MNKRWSKVGAGLAAMGLACTVGAATLSNNNQRIEETLQLTALIDMGSQVSVPLDVISLTPPFQTVVYDSAQQRFEDMGIALRALSERSDRPLQLEILGDNYQCASLSLDERPPRSIVEINRGYTYRVESAGRMLETLTSPGDGGPSRYSFSGIDWQQSGDLTGVAANRHVLDFYLRVSLPNISAQLPPAGPATPLSCNGQVRLLVSIPL